MASSVEFSPNSQIPIAPSFGQSLGGVSRRDALKQMAAVGASAALSVPSVFAGMPRVDSNPKLGRIDVHHHMLPPFYMDLRRAVPNVGVMPTWSRNAAVKLLWCS